MEFAVFIFLKLIALFSFVVLGFVSRRFIGIDRLAISQLVFYIISPIVFFQAIAKLNPEVEIFVLPLVTASISSILAILIFLSTKGFVKDTTRAIFSFISTNSNVGYFLLPIVWELFDDVAAGIFVVMVIGNNIYENTVGFFIAARGKFSLKESLLKLLKLPAFYAMIFGFTFSVVDCLSIPAMFNDAILSVKGAYSTLGMMIIGFGLADIKNFKLDFSFIISSFIVKFLFWPGLTLGFIYLDQNVIHFFDPIVYKMLILFSVAPLAANNIVIATVLELHPEKVAASVFLSTIFAIFYVPLVIALFKLG
ncbi:MAG: AEC family transporter [Rickettsiales bacterium]